MKKYKKLQIIKHALQHYLARENATSKDLEQEQRLLSEIEEEVNQLKESYGIK